MQLPPIATTTVGSFPRPSWLAATERSRVNFVLEGPALKEAQDDATALSIFTQERIGLTCSPTRTAAQCLYQSYLARDGIDLGMKR
jgi:methionine synthase II (cobalamin-independent)